MPLNDRVTKARTGTTPGLIHKLINLNLLDWETINLSSVPKEEALKQCVEKAKQKRYSAFVLQFKKGAVRVISIKAADISANHPQVVNQIGKSGYYTMKSSIAV